MVKTGLDVSSSTKIVEEAPIGRRIWLTRHKKITETKIKVPFLITLKYTQTLYLKF